jgi:cytoskeleton protein RodZ
MTEHTHAAGTPNTAPVAAPGSSAGLLLRQARQAQGLHIAALAAAIKVPPRKLDALENDRHDELLDATFTRALAQTVCRTLKIDPAPVLALLPLPPGHRLENVAEGINAPFRERPGLEVTDGWSLLRAPAVWGPALIVVAAALVFFMPRDIFTAAAPAANVPAPTTPEASAAAPPVVPGAVVSPPSLAGSPPTTVIETVHSSPVLSAIDAASAPSAGPPAVAGALQLRATAESWIEVLDARGQALMSRSLQPGETVGLDGAMPLRVTVGNATATEVTFRGKSLDLSARTRDNVARLELN